MNKDQAVMLLLTRITKNFACSSSLSRSELNPAANRREDKEIIANSGIACAPGFKPERYGHPKQAASDHAKVYLRLDQENPEQIELASYTESRKNRPRA